MNRRELHEKVESLIHEVGLTRLIEALGNECNQISVKIEDSGGSMPQSRAWTSVANDLLYMKIPKIVKDNDGSALGDSSTHLRPAST